MCAKFQGVFGPLRRNIAVLRKGESSCRKKAQWRDVVFRRRRERKFEQRKKRQKNEGFE